LHTVDLIIVATTTADKTFPSVAVKVQSGLGIKSQVPAFDLQAVCSGFVYGLEIANCFILSKKYQSILLIGADKMSSIVNWNDRSTCVLFGDGAGAVVIQSSSDQSGIIDSLMCSDGSFYNFLHTDGGPSSSDNVGKILMDGQNVFKHAVIKMSQVIKELLSKNNIKKSQVKCFIPHQANQRITEAIRKEVDLSEEQVISTVSIHANCSAGSIPLALHHALQRNKIQKGDIILLAAFGGGFTWGALLIRW
jgi:3-oxoacyl-[acyl-carrier-protein] synthase III